MRLISTQSPGGPATRIYFPLVLDAATGLPITTITTGSAGFKLWYVSDGAVQDVTSLLGPSFAHVRGGLYRVDIDESLSGPGNEGQQGIILLEADSVDPSSGRSERFGIVAYDPVVNGLGPSAILEETIDPGVDVYAASVEMVADGAQDHYVVRLSRNGRPVPYASIASPRLTVRLGKAAGTTLFADAALSCVGTTNDLCISQGSPSRCAAATPYVAKVDATIDGQARSMVTSVVARV